MIDRLLTRWRRLVRDEALSSMLGFIVAMVMLVGSMTAVGYYIDSVNDERGQVGTTHLETAASRAATALTTSSGEPANWDASPGSMTHPGLLDANQAMLAEAKLQLLRDGTITARDLLDGLDLSGEAVTMRVEGRVLPSPLLTPPGSTTYAVAEADSSDPLAAIALDSTSVDYLKRLGRVDKGFTPKVHDWRFGWSAEPSLGLGNTHPDDAWYVETQLGPQLAGLRASYATFSDLGTPSGASAKTVYDTYTSGSDKVNRWRIVHDNGSLGLATSGPPTASHALVVGYHKGGSSGGGIGQWRSLEGGRAWALAGPFEVSDADSVAMTMTYLAQDHPSSKAQARILFWNASATAWTALPTASKCTAATGWDDTNYDTGGVWAPVTIDLCEPLTYGLGQVWLAFYWDSWCEALGLEITCASPKELKSGWFIDHLKVTKVVSGSPETLLTTDMSPGGRDPYELVALSHGVDHGLLGARTGAVSTYVTSPVTEFVEAGGDVLAFAPGGAGNWLGAIGLEAVAASPTSPVTTPDPKHRYVKMPNRLPTEHAVYISGPFAWDPTPVGPLGRSPTHALDQVQVISAASVSTVITGHPEGRYKGAVTATSYAFESWSGTPELEDLRADTVKNLYSMGIFNDPSFETGQFAVPTGGVKVASAKRAVLAQVTDDGLYNAPVEITLFLWDVAQTCPDLPGGVCA